MSTSTRLASGVRCLVAAALVTGASVSGANDGDNLTTTRSNHSVATTMDRLSTIVTDKGFTIFARVDHAAGASKVGTSLRPTQLLLFGNPKAGTALMTSAQSVGLELPIRVLVWEDEHGQVWLGYTPPETLAARHGITDRDPVLARMTQALGSLTGAAAR